MNNLRLLTGLLFATLCGSGAVAEELSRRVISLEEIFEIAETRSAQLRPAFSAEAEAAGEISVAKSARLPEINASLSVGYIGDGFTTARDFSDYEKAPIPHLSTGLALNVAQPVYTGGAVTNAVRMAEIKSTAARYATEFRRDNIRFRLAGFYLDLYKYANLRSVVESNLAQARKLLAEMQARFEQGVALRNDITRYELLVSNLGLQLIKIDNTLNILNRNLVVTAGLPESAVVIPDSAMLTQALPLLGEESWQEDAKANSPALRMAESGVALSSTAENLVKAARLPKVALQAGWTMDGPILVEVPPINRNLSYWFVGVGVSYDISSLFKTNKALARSRAATLKARQELEAEQENLQLAVRADYVRYMEAYEELKTQEKSVELALRNYDVVSTRYASGMALITDMLDAANSRLDAEQQLVNARINIIYYYYKLLFTSGKI